MFVIMTVLDVIRLPPSSLLPTSSSQSSSSSSKQRPIIQAIHNEIDMKYPNRVLLDVGLVIGRYGNCLNVGHGVCVAGDGGTHHECKFRLIVFRPFVEEVCLGRITSSTPEGVHVSLGEFFYDIFIPAYWMLRPSKYEEKTGLWVWTPQYDDDNDDEGGDGEEGGGGGKTKEATEEEGSGMQTESPQGEDEQMATINDNKADEAVVAEEEENNRYEMEIGSEIRFKVKSINFTQITNTAKGMQATTTTTAHSNKLTRSGSAGSSGDTGTAAAAAGSTAAGTTDTTSSSSLPGPVRRKRSSSMGAIDDTQTTLPAAMYIVASICEDGLGLTSWWANPDDDEDADVDDDDDAEGKYSNDEQQQQQSEDMAVTKAED